MKARVLVKAVMALFVVFMFSACGYYNPYAAEKSGGKPVGLYRTMWTNRTAEMGLENVFFQSQSDWLRKSRLITSVDSSTTADYVLSGVIEQVNYPEIAFGRYQVATQGRVELTVNFTLTDNKSGKPTWKRSATRTQTFTMSQDLMALKASKSAAFKKIADRFGEEIYLYMINTIVRPGVPPPVEDVTQDVIQD